MKLYQRNDSGVWWVSHGTGNTRIRQSTGSKDYDEAKKIAQEICASSLLLEEADKIEMAGRIAAGKRKVVEIHERSMILLSKCWEMFPHNKAKNGRPLSKHSVESAKLSWRLFVEYAESYGLRHVCEINEKFATRYLEQLKPRMMEISFIYCRAMYERIGFGKNPFTQKPYIDKTQARHREPLTTGQIKKLLEHIDNLQVKYPQNLEMRGFVRFVLYTGLRLGDAVMMKVADVDYVKMEVKRYLIRKTKRRVSFPIHSSLMPFLSRTGVYLFPELAKIYQAGHKSITKKFKKILQACGIMGNPGEYCIHCLRTTFATMCCENNVPIAVIQSWLGHESRFVTEIYARHNDMRKKKEAVDKLPTY